MTEEEIGPEEEMLFNALTRASTFIRQDFGQRAGFTQSQGITWFVKGEICYDVKSDINRQGSAACLEKGNNLLDILLPLR